MEILVHCVHIQNGNIMPRECAIIVTIHKEGLKWLRYANIPKGWPMLVECATVAIKLRNGKNSAGPKNRINLALELE